MEKLFERPIFFERNRVFRIYKGGLLFHDFFGDEAKDGNYPEEWVASSVRAMNLDSTNEKEGISKIKDRTYGTHRRGSLLLHGFGADHPAADHEALHHGEGEKDQDGAASSCIQA